MYHTTHGKTSNRIKWTVSNQCYIFRLSLKVKLWGSLQENQFGTITFVKPAEDAYYIENTRDFSTYLSGRDACFS